MPILGGDNAWLKRINHGLVSSYQWLNGEPALFLFPAGKERGGAFVLPLESAHQWVMSNGHPDLAHAIPVAMQAAKTMGLGADKSTIRRIVDVIIDGIPDLLRMPPKRPEPEQQGPAIGEAAIKIDGETVAEREINA